MRVVLDTNVLVSAIYFSGTPACRLVEPVSVPETACDDPEDLKFLGCAVAGGARCIVTGDRALLRASGYERIAVLTPSSFSRRYL